MDDILIVVISQSPGQLLVVHLGLVLPQPPPSGNLKNGTEVYNGLSLTLVC